MTDPTTTGLLIILLILLTTVWTYPLFRTEIRGNKKFLAFKAAVHLIAGTVMLWLSVASWNPDISMILRLVAGFVLLYEGAITLLNIHADMKTPSIRERGM